MPLRPLRVGLMHTWSKPFPNPNLDNSSMHLEDPVYQAFLAKFPLWTIAKEMVFRGPPAVLGANGRVEDRCDFNVNTSMAGVVGYYMGVDKRAISVVLGRNADHIPDNETVPPAPEPPNPDLTDEQKITVNLAVQQFYGPVSA